MSNNNQDQPDDYDAIFGNANSEADDKTTIEISDGEAIKPQEYIDVDEIEIPTSEPREFGEGEDGDIEEGIFAPARKERVAGKKTGPLMWAVSLLAFVGVGSFVYVSNPDIVAKMTQNIGNEDVTIANPVSPEPTNEATQDAPPAQVAENEPPVTPVPEPTPDVVAPNPDMSAEPIVPPADLTANNPADAVVASVAPTVPVPAPTSDISAPTPTVAAPDSAVVAPTPEITLADNNITPPSMETATEAAKAAAVDASVNKSAETVSPIVKNNDVTPPNNIGVTPPTEGAKTITSASPTIEAAPDVIAPTNEPEESTDTTTVAHQPAPTVSAPDVSPQEKAATELTTNAKADNETSSKEKEPVVAVSKEEKKRLDDAKLDQYFDSPGGHILSMIPAPSMNPKKGSNESIIIVNKKGSKAAEKTAKASPPQSKNVVIETTTLDTQIISANRALKLGRYEAAKEMYDDLYKLSPRDAKVLSGRAIVLQKMGMADQAISAYEELLKIYPDNADAIVNWSGLIRKQYPAVALSKLLDLHMSQPENNVVTAQLGVANADAGNYADAVRYLGDAAAAEPKNPLHFYNLAVVSEKAGNRQQAVTYYEKALEVDAIYGDGQNTIPREKIYDRLSQIRGN